MMATYSEIIEWVKMNHGISVKTCHISHARQLSGLPVQVLTIGMAQVGSTHALRKNCR